MPFAANRQMQRPIDAPGGGYQPRLPGVEPTQGADAARGSVLVCDDTESIRRLLRINLELDGFDVHEAADGAAAVQVLAQLGRQQRLPRVVILDAQMSPRDGWWALEQIRSSPTLTGIPVIMATAAPACEDRERVRAAGLDACVRKPFDPDVVLAMVDRFAREGREADVSLT